MNGRTTVAAFLVAAISLPAFGGGYVERYNEDDAGFDAYKGGLQENIWWSTGGSSGGTSEGCIYGGDFDYNVMVFREVDQGDQNDPWIGPHGGQALMIDLKGVLRSSKQTMYIRIETGDTAPKYHGWLGSFMYKGWPSDVAIEDGATWVRCILPLNVNQPVPVDLTGGGAAGVMAWTYWTREEDLINGDQQEDLLYTLENMGLMVLEGFDWACRVDNLGLIYSGDANGDGEVGIADLVALAENYGQTGDASWTAGDFTSDFEVGIADLVCLADNYGMKTSDLLPPAVPEPATLLLFAAGAAAVFLKPRR